MTERKDTKSSEKAVTEQRPAMMRPFEEMERWYENLFPRGWLRPFPTDWPSLRSASFVHRIPAVDMLDRENDVIVRAEVPGVRKEDLKISVSDSTLTIKGHTEHEEEEKREDYYCHELSYGDFSRTLELPAEVDGSKAEAKMKDGMLEIQIPKLEHAKRREVSVEIH